MTKQEILDWKNNPITKEVLKAIKERIKGIEQDLGQDAGLDPLRDRFRAGAIAAYSDFYFLEFDFQEETL